MVSEPLARKRGLVHGQAPPTTRQRLGGLVDLVATAGLLEVIVLAATIVAAGAGLPGGFVAGLISSVLPRKNTEAMVATRTSAGPISPKRIGVQNLLGCAVRPRHFLLTIFLLFDQLPAMKD